MNVKKLFIDGWELDFDKPGMVYFRSEDLATPNLLIHLHTGAVERFWTRDTASTPARED